MSPSEKKALYVISASVLHMYYQNYYNFNFLPQQEPSSSLGMAPPLEGMVFYV